MTLTPLGHIFVGMIILFTLALVDFNYVATSIDVEDRGPWDPPSDSE